MSPCSCACVNVQKCESEAQLTMTLWHHSAHEIPGVEPRTKKYVYNMSHMMMMRRRRGRRPIIAPIRAGGALVVAAALGLVVGEHGPQVARLHTLAKHGSWAHVCMSGAACLRYFHPARMHTGRSSGRRTHTRQRMK
jgi:hypothetical protein